MSNKVTYILQTYGEAKPEEEVVSKTGLLLIDGDVINYIRPISSSKILINIKRNADWYKSKDDSVILKPVTFASNASSDSPQYQPKESASDEAEEPKE